MWLMCCDFSTPKFSLPCIYGYACLDWYLHKNRALPFVLASGDGITEKMLPVELCIAKLRKRSWNCWDFKSL